MNLSDMAVEVIRAIGKRKVKLRLSNTQTDFSHSIHYAVYNVMQKCVLLWVSDRENALAQCGQT